MDDAWPLRNTNSNCEGEASVALLLRIVRIPNIRRPYCVRVEVTKARAWLIAVSGQTICWRKLLSNEFRFCISLNVPPMAPWIVLVIVFRSERMSPSPAALAVEGIKHRLTITASTHRLRALR